MNAIAKPTNYGSNFGRLLDPKIFQRLPRITPSKIAEATLEACFKLVERSTISEPHFLWEDFSTVVISPSDYQFAPFQDTDYELVSIDEDDVPYREFCSEALDSLEFYQTLSDDWDEDGAPAPTESSLYDASLLLRTISARVSSCPNIVTMLDFEGIPSFAFDTNSTYVSVACYGEGRLVTYYLDRKCNASTSREFSLTEVDALHDFLEVIESL
ncbi:hypothetical protein PS689_00576 [Pseudomonas fluorescens]|nr:hypothetical protein [Pseudomonas alliivorans]VVN73540.1 hypothetical protein PS689_00576 [Pseudomonas fluorescens]